MESFNRRINSIVSNRIFLHLLFWITLYVVLVYFTRLENDLKDGLKIILLVVFPLVIPVYLNFYIIERYLFERRYAQYFSLLVLVLTSGVLIHYFIFNTFNSSDTESGSIVSVLVLVILTTIIKYARHNVSIRSKLQKAETERINTELQLLKSQINPHFLFNSLNTIYSMAQKSNSKEISDFVSKLSSLLRYMLYESNLNHIGVAKEIDYIKKYIELQKVRYVSSKMKVNFHVGEETENVSIAPAILIPLVENAFKHGVSINNESFININLNASGLELIFIIENSINSNTENIEKGGLGLRNLKQRLNIIYPEKHQLNISKKDNIYKVELIIKYDD